MADPVKTITQKPFSGSATTVAAAITAYNTAQGTAVAAALVDAATPGGTPPNLTLCCPQIIYDGTTNFIILGAVTYTKFVTG